MAARTKTLLAIAALLAGCHSKTEPFEVVRVLPEMPGSESGGEAQLFLNQELTVYFNQPVEPMSIIPESVRVLDEGGRPVPGRLTIGTRSVTFVPVPPVTPALDDGSFVPGRSYRLEVVGLPSLAVKSARGWVLEKTLRRRFKVLAEAPTKRGYPTLFLPVGSGTESLALQVGPEMPLRMAAGTHRLRLDFNLPLLPTSVRENSFEFHRIRTGSTSPEQLVPSEIRIVPGRVPGARYYGSSVEVEFSPRLGIAPEDTLYVILAGDEERVVRDYGGRKLAVAGGPVEVRVDPGDRVRARDIDLEDLDLSPVDGVPLGFEVRNGRLFPRCRVEAGSGQLGWFRPRESMVLEPDVAFDRGDGVLVSAGRDFDFVGIDIPEGVTVTVRSRRPLRMRAQQDISIAGVLHLETPSPPTPWRSGGRVDPEQALMAAGFALVSAGDLVVEGAVRHPLAGGSAATLLSGGDMVLAGRLPPSCVLGPGGELRGAVESPVTIDAPLTPGLPAGLELEAAATADLNLPPRHSGSIDVRAEDRRGGISISVQISPDGKVLRTPEVLPLKVALYVPPGGMLRLVLRGMVRGREQPSVGGIVVQQR